MQLRSGSIHSLTKLDGGSKKNIKQITAALVYDYTLRCAIHAYLEQNNKNNNNSNSTGRDRRLSYRHSVHLGSFDVFGSSGDDIKDKLTKPVVIALIRRLDDIKSGKDLSKSDYLDRRFIAIVRLAKDAVKQHRYRPQGSINDLASNFRKITENELRKQEPNPSIWYKDLDRYVVLLTEVLLLVLNEDAPNSASQELIDSLNQSIASKPLSKIRNSTSMTTTMSSSTDILTVIENHPMVKTVQNLFRIEQSIHRKKIQDLQPICTEMNYLLDLKQLMNALNQNLTISSRREDFPSQQAYDAWSSREMKYLQGLTSIIGASSSIEVEQESSGLLSPNIYLGRRSSESKRNSVYKNSATLDNHIYTYIPNDPRSYFKILMNMCVDLDTNIEPDTERAKSSVLSQASEDLLRECWKTWRISQPYRAVLYLDIIKSRMETVDVITDIDIEEARDAMRALDKCLKENDIRSWTINDRETMVHVLEDLNETCLKSLAQSLTKYWRASPEFIREQVAILDSIYENPAYLETHFNPIEKLVSLEDNIAGAAVSRWRSIEKALVNPENDDITNLMNLADKLIKELVSVSKKFKKPIKGVLYVPGIVLARQMPFFVLEMENWAFLPEAKSAPIDSVFELYDKVLTLKRLYDQYGPKQKSTLFKVESWFLLHVKRWLNTTADETPEWIYNAIKQDEFKPINDTNLHSSSIVDLFTMFNQAIEFVQKLEWPNSLQEYHFYTALSKVMGVALEQYTEEIEKLIEIDMYPHTFQEDGNYITTTFLDRARSQLIGNRPDSKINEEPYEFSAKTCVKINNIESARIKLDRLYQNMDVDGMSQEMKDQEIQQPIEKEQPSNYLYSIKIVRAENLSPKRNTVLCNPYVVLEIDSNPILRTKTVYETLNPRWDQGFDLWLSNETIDVLALVYDEDVIGADEETGGVWFQLGPSYYGDFQTHELVLNFNPQGRLIVRINMEGEKDDIQFWFIKAFRLLKRSENDTQSHIVDRMGIYFRQILNRKTLDTLLGKDRSFFSSFSRSYKHVDPTLQDCENAIAPLIDYLERNLKILNDHLSETSVQPIILKIWKEILVTLENVLLPPLSEELSNLQPLDDYEFHVVFKWVELLKILFNGGEDGDAIPLNKLENSQYYALLAINAAYYMETSELIEGYNTVLKNQIEMKLRGGRRADRSRSIYRSHNTAEKSESIERKNISIELPSSDTILRILRMRKEKRVRDFLHQEFEKRNNPVPFTSEDNTKTTEEIPPIPDITTADSNSTTEKNVPLR